VTVNLFDHANACCRRLWRDESGVALALTVIVFLSLFVIACSVYAAGEHIRQRIELQNAADAAAYSAAVVQADALSRIAVINKAMAWSHVQMGKAVMDYDVDVWLEMICTKWTVDYNTCLAQILPYYYYRNTFGRSWIGSDKGWYPSCYEDGAIQLNKNNRYPYSTLSGFWTHSSASYQKEIDHHRKAIKEMNEAEEAIKKALRSRVSSAVAGVLQQNTGSPNAQENEYLYSLICSQASDYFETLKDEGRLLKFFEPGSDAGTAFNNDGINVWFNLLGGDGIQRGYQQQDNSLRADWSWHLEGWIWYKKPIQVYGPVEGSDVVLGIDGETTHGGTRYYQSESVKPQILTGDYFGAKGAIVVSVARRLTNPLLFMAADPSNPGLYSFFAPVSSGGKSLYIWASAAARAGYHKNGGAQAEYWTKDSAGWLNSPANLSQADWDAEFIPLPWATDAQQLWNANAWQSLFGSGSGGSSLGTYAGGSPPAGAYLH